MIKRFCDRCGTELSKNDYAYFSMHGCYDKNAELRINIRNLKKILIY